MTIDGDDELEGLRRAGAAVADARDEVLAAVEPGVRTDELDALAAEVLDRHGARSAPALTYRFPGTVCLSVNDVIAHGLPGDRRRLLEGDLINVDVSAELDGFWADTGASAPVGRVSTEAGRLLQATRLAQRDAMHAARAGRRLSDVGRAVQRRARRHGFTVIENLCGHGIGRALHEPPSVPSTDDRKASRTVLHEGLVLAIEPFLSTGSRMAVEDPDGWSLRTSDGGLGAQFEHTVVVTKGKPLVLTASRS